MYSTLMTLSHERIRAYDSQLLPAPSHPARTGRETLGAHAIASAPESAPFQTLGRPASYNAWPTSAFLWRIWATESRTRQNTGGRIVILGQALRQGAFAGRFRPVPCLSFDWQRSPAVLACGPPRFSLAEPPWPCVRPLSGEFHAYAPHPHSGGFPPPSAESPALPEACAPRRPRPQRSDRRS